MLTSCVITINFYLKDLHTIYINSKYFHVTEMFLCDRSIHTDKEGGGNVLMGTEIAVKWPKVK